MRNKKPRQAYERYGLERSPLAQRPTQRDLAALVGETKADLNTIAQPHFKEKFLVRRKIQSSMKAKPALKRPPVTDEKRVKNEIYYTITSGGKERSLVYPIGRLRSIHEKLKFHLNKIVQPDYLMSPRKGRTQRDNASSHSGNVQYLKIDLKQFYPSTTRTMIRASLIRQFGMAHDVAGCIAHLATADDRACFGSPLTPVLMSLVHRQMFDAIADLCDKNGLRYSVWVDDLTISGPEVKGSVLLQIRKIVRDYGLRSHKLEYRTGNRVVFITGVGVIGSELRLPKYMELKGRFLWDALRKADSFLEVDSSSKLLLAHLGSARQVVGPKSKRGKRLADQMNAIRQKRAQALKCYEEHNRIESDKNIYSTPTELEERREEIEAIPF